MSHAALIRSPLLALAVAAAVSATTPAAPRREGIMAVGVFEEPRSLNPLFAESRLEREAAQCLFSALYRLDDDGDYIVDLLSGMPARKGLAYQYELRKGVRFSDGHELTAEDVKFTWECLAGLNPPGLGRPGVEKITSFEIPYVTYKGKDGKTYKTPDKYHFTVVLQEVDPAYEAFWADLPILPAHILAEEAKAAGGKLLREGGFSRRPIGSGPFKMVEWKQGTYLMMVRNPLYFRSGQPYLDEMIWRFLPNTAAGLEGLRRGEIDLLLDLPVAQAGEAVRIPWIILAKKPEHTCTRIVVNLWDPKDLSRPHPILGDVRVRQALDLAFPRERLVERILDNLAYPAYTGIPPFSRFYHRIPAGSRFDPEKARRLLDEAGWITGPDGYRYKEGRRLRLALSTTAGSEGWERAAAFCREAWQPMGVDLSVEFLDLATFSAECLAKRRFELAMFPWQAEPAPGLLSPWHSRQIPGEEHGGTNYGGYHNEDMDGLLAEMARTEDGEKRKALCRRIQEILIQEVPSIFLSFHAQIAAIRIGFKNFRPNPGGNDFWNVNEWYRAW